MNEHFSLATMTYWYIFPPVGNFLKSFKADPTRYWNHMSKSETNDYIITFFLLKWLNRFIAKYSTKTMLTKK